MLSRFFHHWERRLAGATTDRVVRPFDWGLDWLGLQDDPEAVRDPRGAIQRYVDGVMADTAAFYAVTPAPVYDFNESTGLLRFESAFRTPHPENNIVHARLFPAARDARGREDTRMAVLVMPQWNADANGHVGLSQLLARFGMSALRLSLPYHDFRMPPELHRADYIVSANIGRTLQVCRQAVLDARRAIAWLAQRGFTQIGILGTSLGSCLA